MKDKLIQLIQVVTVGLGFLSVGLICGCATGPQYGGSVIDNGLVDSKAFAHSNGYDIVNTNSGKKRPARSSSDAQHQMVNQCPNRKAQVLHYSNRGDRRVIRYRCR